jgi:CubicO group peptidase (beta-lactamase class C family)
MVSIVLALALAAVEPRVQTAVELIGEKNCPRLFARLSPPFQKVAPSDSWPKWCASVGALTDLEAAKPSGSWLRYRAKSPRGPVRFEIAFDAAGKISGLRVSPEESLPKIEGPLEDALKELRTRHHLPGLAVYVQRAGEPPTALALGVRKDGDATPVTANDRWHLGSGTKAMTATLAAILVDEKKLRWDSTVSEVFSDWKDLHPAYAGMTLELLLSHRAGFPTNIPRDPLSKLVGAPDDRASAARAVLKDKPANDAGQYAYSNAGYIVAGAMLEKVTGSTWEALLTKRVFEPLGMKSCGFGAPATPGKIDQPWGHRLEGGKLAPIEPGPASDNPPSTGPAGTVHCTLQDWARFGALHIAQRPTLVSAASMTKLHTAPPGSTYALGWIVAERSWVDGKVLTHDGSNTLFYATIWLAPASNQLYLVATNAGGDGVEQAIGEVVALLVSRFSDRSAP